MGLSTIWNPLNQHQSVANQSKHHPSAHPGVRSLVRLKWIRVFLVSLLLLLGLGIVGPGLWRGTLPLVGVVHAQDEQPGEGEAGEGEAGTTQTTEKAPKENIIFFILKAILTERQFNEDTGEVEETFSLVGLFFALVLLVISIALIALVVLLAMELRMGAAIPPLFVEDFTDTVNKRRFREAFEMAKEDSSFLARVLTSGMGRLQYGIEDARDAAFNMVESVKSGKEQLVTFLATIGTIGPLIGLVTTVYGMILAFRNLAGSETVQTDVLAGDISKALAGTLLGIGVALPAIFCHAFFRNRLSRLSLEVGNASDDLLTQMYHNSKRPAPTPSAPAAPAASASAAPEADARPQGSQGVRQR